MDDGRVALRSTLTPDAPPYVVTAQEWTGFLEAVKTNRFDAV
jgi:hypothetical protein